MACMEHICVQPECGWYTIDNNTYKKCPDCGGSIRSYFDEEGDHHAETRTFKSDSTIAE